MLNRSIAGLWIFYAVVVVAIIAGQSWCGLVRCASEELTTEIAGGVSLLAFAIGAMVLLYRQAPELFRRPRLLELLGLPLWSVPISWCFAGAAISLMPQAQGNISLEPSATWLELLPIWLVVAGVVPLAEEVLFRGWIFRGFYYNDGLRSAVWFSALLFGLAHILPMVVVYAFAGGLVWARYMAKGGTLWTTIFAHAVSNSLPFIITLFIQDSPLAPPSQSDTGADLLSGVFFVGLGIALMVLYFRRNPLPTVDSVNTQGQLVLRENRISWPLMLTLSALSIAFVISLLQTLVGIF